MGWGVRLEEGFVFGAGVIRYEWMVRDDRNF